MGSGAEELRRLIDTEAEHAEATKDEPVPADALGRATRPGLARSVMFSLRLNPDEIAAVHALAETHDVAASTLVRGWILQRLAAERNHPDDTAAMLDRLESDVRVLRKLVAS
jgi:transposase-like protein